MAHRPCYQLRIDAVTPNKRLSCTLEVIDALCVAISTRNSYDPIEVWFDGERFRIVDGEKRYRACKRLKMSHIEAVIVE